MLNTCRFV